MGNDEERMKHWPHSEIFAVLDAAMYKLKVLRKIAAQAEVVGNLYAKDTPEWGKLTDLLIEYQDS